MVNIRATSCNKKAFSVGSVYGVLFTSLKNESIWVVGGITTSRLLHELMEGSFSLAMTCGFCPRFQIDGQCYIMMIV